MSSSWNADAINAVLQARREQSRINRVVSSKFYKKTEKFSVEQLMSLCQTSGIPVRTQLNELDNTQAIRFQLVQEILSRRCACKTIVNLQTGSFLRCEQCKITVMEFKCVVDQESLETYKDRGWICQGCNVDNYVCSDCRSGGDDVMECEKCQVRYSCLKCDGRTQSLKADLSWYCKPCRGKSLSSNSTAASKRSSTSKKRKTAPEIVYRLSPDERERDEQIAKRIKPVQYEHQHQHFTEMPMTWTSTPWTTSI